MKILIYCSFDGTAYHGYQVQKGGGITVQGELNRAARELFGFDCDIVGCSRTDAGVHAKMFCATVAGRGINHLPTSLPIEKIPRALSAHLPQDICVYNAVSVQDDFHPRYTVCAKEYEYRFFVRQIKDPFENGRSWHVPLPLLPDAEQRMRRAASYFCGKHDFTSFMAQGSKITDATRTVYSADIKREGDIISFRVCADGFLYNMVRIMAGTLMECAVQGSPRDPESIPEVIAAKDRALAGRTAPAHGLYLYRVSYPEQAF